MDQGAEEGREPREEGSGQDQEGRLKPRKRRRSSVHILGIDPGTRITGFGLIECRGSRLRLVEAGTLRPPRGAPEDRLADLARQAQTLLERLRPDAAAVESAFVKADARAALTLGEARGVLLAACGAAEVPVTSYPPATVKKSVTGSGRAAKEQVARMVARVLGLAAAPEPADATDALALAVTHALRTPRPRPAAPGAAQIETGGMEADPGPPGA